MVVRKKLIVFTCLGRAVTKFLGNYTVTDGKAETIFLSLKTKFKITNWTSPNVLAWDLSFCNDRPPIRCKCSRILFSFHSRWYQTAEYLKKLNTEFPVLL